MRNALSQNVTVLFSTALQSYVYFSIIGLVGEYNLHNLRKKNLTIKIWNVIDVFTLIFYIKLIQNVSMISI